MPNPAADSELYGDIYSDEFSDFIDPTEDEAASTSEDQNPSAEQDDPSEPAPEDDDDDEKKPDQQASTSSALSYSAQIAQQFSAYKQDPSQERQLRPDARQSTTVTTNNGTIFGKKPSEMHDAGKIFVGGLSWDTTDGITSIALTNPNFTDPSLSHLFLHVEGLRDYFEQFGKVDACTIMRDPTTGTSRGFAFLTFEDPNCLNQIFSREHTLDGKTIDPKRAIPREEHLRNTRYFVGGLAHSTTADSMKTFFSQYGKVIDTSVMIDRESGRSKGFGFVTFEDAGTGLDQIIVGRGLLTLDDKEIEVKLAQPRSQREQTRNLVNKITSTRESTPDRPPINKPPPMLPPAPNNVMGMMFPRPGNHLPIMSNMMAMNPMMSMGMSMGMPGMGMAMGGLNPMAGGGGSMPGMNMMGGMNPGMMQHAQNMGAMRKGGMMGGGNPGMMMGNMAASMSPMNANGGGGMGGMGMGMGMGVGGNMAAKNMMMMNMNQGLGPVRMNNAANRKQHSGFHPYSR